MQDGKPSTFREIVSSAFVRKSNKTNVIKSKLEFTFWRMSVHTHLGTRELTQTKLDEQVLKAAYSCVFYIPC